MIAVEQDGENQVDNPAAILLCDPEERAIEGGAQLPTLVVIDPGIREPMRLDLGVGHTAAAGAPDPARLPRGMPADLDAGIREALRLFRVDLGRYQAEVVRAVTVPLAAHEFDALVSFHYNTGAIARAALTRHLTAGDRAAAGVAFMNWLRPTSLRSRREAERDLFLHGRYPEGPIPVWAVDADGRVDFSRPVRRLAEPQALALLQPAPAAEPTSQVASAPRPSRWLAALLASFSTAFQRS